jgi:hypothetical protein
MKILAGNLPPIVKPAPLVVHLSVVFVIIIMSGPSGLNYWKNPLASDLEDERTHLRNLQNQQPTKDDQGQLQWDIDNTRRRIQELQEDLQRQQQRSTAGTTDLSSGQSAQPQGASYTAPSQGYGAGGPAGQTPPIGSGGVYGHPGGHAGPPPRIPWDTQVGPSGGGACGGSKPTAGGKPSGGSKGGCPGGKC